MKLFDMLFKRKDKSEKLQVVQADEKESAEVVQQLSADKDNTIIKLWKKCCKNCQEQASSSLL